MSDELEGLSTTQRKILEQLDGSYISEVAKTADVSYAHVVKVLKELYLPRKLVTMNKRGRIQQTIITEKGRRVLHLAQELKKELKEPR